MERLVHNSTYMATYYLSRIVTYNYVIHLNIPFGLGLTNRADKTSHWFKPAPVQDFFMHTKNIYQIVITIYNPCNVISYRFKLI